MKTVQQLIFAASLLLAGAAAAAQNAYYVKPGGTGSGTSPGDAFGTIEQARDAIRARSDASITGDITVYLLPGTYFLQAPLTFDNRDSGRNRHKVIYQAHDAAQPVVISGGRPVTGPWQRGENGIWYTSVEPSIFTQLYVNGQRATPSREPDEGWKELKQWEDRYGSKSIRLKGPDNLKKEWQRQEQIEFLVKYHWAIMRLRIATWGTYDNDNVIFPPKGEDRIWSAIAPRQNDQRYRLENALEFVDEPGEWYLDYKAWRLHYLPRPGENITTAVVIAPRQEHLVTITGSDADYPVRGIEFHGLRFEHANWLFKEGKEGYVGAQAWIQWNDWRAGPGAVELTHTEDVRFTNNVFRNLGGVGLKLVQGTGATQIERNTFLDIGDTAILIYTGPIDPKKADLRDAVQSRDDVVRDNVVRRFGQWNLAAAGISLVIGQRCIIEHNEVSDGGYAGIT
ncbi:MAG: right-handed parallel beta-helix repeat-containing protein, partial [Armatimonadota bacterium]|nr:right-handed parallel beta-helix repeat-containing protein [Armatimonadota bacterium]